jgi:Ca2+-binding EF-hand superfamily protein
MSFRECEVQKEVLTKQDKFVVLNAFCRIDTRQKQHIDTMDLMAFFRDSSLVVSEADCYMLVKQFDSNHDGYLSLVE